MDKKQFKKVAKIVLFVYAASFFIINWDDISWIFNYREVTGLVGDFFNPYPSVDAAPDSSFYPNHSQTQAVAQTIKTNYTDKQKILEIPKISIEAPIVFSTQTDNALVKKDLNSGVVFYPGSVYPGQAGQIIILGHSAPQGWPKIKYDWIFSDIGKLTAGDTIYIDLDNKQYKYIVKEKKIVEKGADVTIENTNSNNNILTLISCWPPGKDYQRIAVYAELSN
jgi:LPXTG-site transpeptidase (sortase) family protein